LGFIQKLRSKFVNKGKDEEDSTKNLVSEAYVRTNRNLFDLNEPKGPFGRSQRSLLVDSILANLEVTYTSPDKNKTIKGLPLLIENEIFEESFILHDQTSHRYFTKILDKFQKDNKDYGPTSIEYLEKTVNQFAMTDIPDTRTFLQENWASLKNIFKFQPITEVRDYFGEKNALYFGFVGSFITMLWLPSLVGVFFFILGISLYYT
jgi:hypothetical protein